MLRIHFTAADLGRVHIAAQADPLWEVLLSSFTLHDHTRAAAFRPWLRRLRATPTWNSHIRPGMQLLAELAPRGPHFPDFVTPAKAESGPAAGSAAVVRTPRARLVRELNLLAGHDRSTTPAWLAGLVADSTTASTHVTTALRRYHDEAITPHHDLIRAGVDADRAQRARDLLDGGVEGLLRGLRPLAQWRPPVLLVRYDVDRDIHLRGRGLRLVPSFFCHGSPVAIADPGLPPVLIYPIAAEHRWAHAFASRSGEPLRALLGATRADVLVTIGRGLSTTELARAVGTSPASASRHAAVLRDAGLVATHRRGPAVLHTLTPLGARLLGHGRAT